MGGEESIYSRKDINGSKLYTTACSILALSNARMGKYRLSLYI